MSSYGVNTPPPGVLAAESGSRSGVSWGAIFAGMSARTAPAVYR